MLKREDVKDIINKIWEVDLIYNYCANRNKVILNSPSLWTLVNFIFDLLDQLEVDENIYSTPKLP